MAVGAGLYERSETRVNERNGQDGPRNPLQLRIPAQFPRQRLRMNRWQSFRCLGSQRIQSGLASYQAGRIG